MRDFRLIEEELRFKFLADGRLALAYNKGHRNWGDYYLSRPNFFPVYTPSGRPVTTNCAYRFNHHKSVFIGHARVNGVNFFHDNNPTLPNLGDIAFETCEPETTSTAVILRTTNGWMTKKGERLLTERRTIVWTPGETAHVLDVESALTSHVGDVTFGKDTHSYLGVRVADTIDVEDGGAAVNANGQRNEEGAMNQLADWVDYSGEVAGARCGVTLMHHPSNPPSPYFVRNYGTMLSNFTLREPYVLKDGDTLTQRFRLLIHDGGTDDVDIAGYRAAFARDDR
jgi:hypothetical protein